MGTEQWRDRRGWFDRLEHSADASVPIRYEVWSDTYLIEGWLSGGPGNGGRSGFGVVAEIPRNIFDTVRSVAGFGDQKARAISATIGLRDLFQGSVTGRGTPGF